MGKTKKKRTKKYSGADAAQARPSIIKVQAANRNPFSQWLYEQRQLIKMGGITLGILVLLVIIISGIISLF